MLKKAAQPTQKLKELILADEERLFMLEYLSLENLNIIKDAIKRFIVKHEEQVKIQQA